MGDKDKRDDARRLEEKVNELERLAGSLAEVPDEQLVGTLGEAVGLLAEINAGIEARVAAAGEEARGAGTLLSGVDFGPFDEALEELERRERGSGEPGS